MGQTRTKVIEAAIEPEKQKKIEEIEKNLPAGKKGQETSADVGKEKTKTPKVRGKRYQHSAAMIDKSKVYPIKEAIESTVFSITPTNRH